MSRMSALFKPSLGLFLFTPVRFVAYRFRKSITRIYESLNDTPLRCVITLIKRYNFQPLLLRLYLFFSLKALL